jgi:hypothetical protein
MHQHEHIHFEEKQYLGVNRLSIMIRLLMALFCFGGYYWSQNPKPVDIGIIRIGYYPLGPISENGEVFFILGVFIILLSVALIYVLHIHTRVYENYILLDGFWGARRVKIELHNVVSVKKIKLKKGTLTSPVYNLYRKGIIRFFSSGREMVELRESDGTTYRIGSQRSAELLKILQQALKKH